MIPMSWFRMLRVAFRLAWPDILTPWRSPLIRWRAETYGVQDEHGRGELCELLVVHLLILRRPGMTLRVSGAVALSLARRTCVGAYGFFQETEHD